MKLLIQLLRCISPMDDVVPADEVSQLSASAFIGIPCFGVDPPVDEPSHPAFAVGVAGRSNVGANPTGRTVTGEHIEELALREMDKFVKHQERYLGTLPVIFLLFIEHVSECDLCTRLKSPLDVRRKNAGRTQMRVYFLARGIKTTGAHNLRTGLSEDYSLEQLVVDVSQTLKQEGVSLAAASCAAVNANVSGRAQKHLLLALLRPNNDWFVTCFFRLFSHVRHLPPNLSQAGRSELAAEQKPACRLSSPRPLFGR